MWAFIHQALVVCIFLGVGMSILSASFSSFLVSERMNNAKHLQMVSGVDKVLFWVTSYLSDLINYLIPFTLIFVCFAAFNQDVFTGNNGLAGIAMLLVFFGISAIPLSYLCHFPFKTPMNSLVAQVQPPPRHSSVSCAESLLMRMTTAGACVHRLVAYIS